MAAFAKLQSQRWLIGLVFLIGLANAWRSRVTPCYDESGRAIWCMTEFRNAAYGKPVEATNTCGTSRPEQFCQAGFAAGKCHVCDASDPTKSHSPSLITDPIWKRTWWQSETMMQRAVQYPNTVNVTINLGKPFDLTYIRMKFQSSRPESFAIYKKTTETSEWVPYQYYSASCQQTYGISNNLMITANVKQATCSDKFSDISPFTGGDISFSPLEGRPNAYNFEKSPDLQEWVTASDIKIVLTRMNTFGDEAFGDAQVLKSYYYAIADLQVGGRCKCNGHANTCVEDSSGRLACKCQHHTKGQNCEMCEDFYNSHPWHRAVPDHAHECEACNCNGHSDKCYFDQKMYDSTGDGGHCIECRDFTTGPHCEKCQDLYCRKTANGPCEPCDLMNG